MLVTKLVSHWDMVPYVSACSHDVHSPSGERFQHSDTKLLKELEGIFSNATVTLRYLYHWWEFAIVGQEEMTFNVFITKIRQKSGTSSFFLRYKSNCRSAAAATLTSAAPFCKIYRPRGPEDYCRLIVSLRSVWDFINGYLCGLSDRIDILISRNGAVLVATFATSTPVSWPRMWA